ncbi:MAG: HDOD domain-containing protein [Phycisphaeraceae bacterium]|nr:HDOD domain-containing protein [Phycisphaeraceae bacterium]
MTPKRPPGPQPADEILIICLKSPHSDDALGCVLKRTGEVSTLPQVITRVLKTANDPEASADDLSRQIESDPALASRVLKIANSAAVALRHRVHGLKQAVSLLGFSAVRNMAVTALVCDVFKKQLQIGPYSRRQLWDHMVSVGLTARMIGRRQGMDGPNEIFLAGLLHDLGIILEDQLDHERFVVMMRRFPDSVTLCEAERLHLGYDHTQLGAAVAEKWNFSPMICEVIRHHHNPLAAGPHAPVVACVELANVMVTLHGIGSVGRPAHRISPAVLKHLSLDRSELEVLVQQMAGEIKTNRSLRSLIQAA